MSSQVLKFLIKAPDGERISKVKVVLIVLVVCITITVPIVITAGNGSKNYREKQQQYAEDNRLNSVNTPMSEANNSNIRLKQYVDQQVEKKKINSQNAYINGMNVPFSDQTVPAINGSMNSSINNETNSGRPPIQPNEATNNADPVQQELMAEKLDRIKRKYVSYQADTSLSPQSSQMANKQNTSQNSAETSNSLKNPQSIPQPTVLAANASPSDGFTHSNANQANNDQNMQGEKNNFLTQTGKATFNNDINDAEVKDPISKYEITAGTPITAFLLTGINSDLPGVVIARVARNLYDSVTGNYLLIPKGSKLIGVFDSNIVYGQNRVMAVWNRVVFPDGTSYRLNGMPGTDAIGQSGLTGEVNNHFLKIYGGALAMSFITAGMQYSQNSTNPNVQVGGIGVTNTNPSIGQTLAGSLGQQMGQAGIQTMQKNLNVQPTIEVAAGTAINIMLTSDLILRPFNQKEYAGNSITIN